MKLVGNGKKAVVLIFVFIAILCFLSWRANAQEPDHILLNVGGSFGPSGSGAALGMDYVVPRGTRRLDWVLGTTLWGSTAQDATNWDWHAGFRTCRGLWCAGLGAAYVQRIDRVSGSHANFALSLACRFGGAHRFEGAEIFHLSNAGTSDVNLGRNAALAQWRLQ